MPVHGVQNTIHVGPDCKMRVCLSGDRMTEPHKTEPHNQDAPPSQPSPPPSANASWTDRVAGIWTGATSQLTKLLPVEQVAQTVVGWFSINEAQMGEILQAIRQELPTTEALLIGKPQAGKSSIVRGLTGVSADIVGQGFRPHTQHTERYAYPSNDLPLLIFTDTVGLGDINQTTQTEC
jgi:hypothetical protein